MTTNLFKPEAERQRASNELRDGIISILIFIAFIGAVCYIGVRLAASDQQKEAKISKP